MGDTVWENERIGGYHAPAVKWFCYDLVQSVCAWQQSDKTADHSPKANESCKAWSSFTLLLLFCTNDLPPLAEQPFRCVRV